MMNEFGTQSVSRENIGAWVFETKGKRAELILSLTPLSAMFA